MTKKKKSYPGPVYTYGFNGKLEDIGFVYDKTINYVPLDFQMSRPAGDIIQDVIDSLDPRRRLQRYNPTKNHSGSPLTPTKNTEI